MPDPIIAAALVVLGIVLAWLFPFWLIILVLALLVTAWAFFARGHERRV